MPLSVPNTPPKATPNHVNKPSTNIQLTCLDESMTQKVEQMAETVIGKGKQHICSNILTLSSQRHCRLSQRYTHRHHSQHSQRNPSDHPAHGRCQNQSDGRHTQPRPTRQTPETAQQGNRRVAEKGRRA